MITVLTLNPSIDRSYVLDDFVRGKVQRARSVVATAGGKGLNVSRVANCLGGKVCCLGFLGGFTGGSIKNEIEAEGLINRFTPIQGTTRICLNFTERSGVSTEVLETGPEILTDEIKQFEQELKNVLKETKILVASGSLARGLPKDYYGKISEICREEKIKFILDSSGESLYLAIEDRPFLIKPNEEELEYITGNPVKTFEDVFLASSKVLEMGAENVCVSLGKQGMMLNGSLGRFLVHVPNIEVVNTVGCGDSLVAGLAYALNEGYNIIQMLKFANGCAISNALHKGVGQIDPVQVNVFAKQVTVTPYVNIK
ncbi:MAG: 1-phosphofructokinase [Firmicutes bacterium]|nr:1-phosphofructokinase [Bacillota bacterium]